MTITVNNLQQFNAGGFSAAANNLDETSSALSTASSSMDSSAQAIGDWQGSTATAASGALNNACSAVHDTGSMLHGLSGTVNAFMVAVLGAQGDLQTALGSLNALSWPNGGKATAEPDGLVTKPPEPTVPAKPTAPGGPSPSAGATSAYNSAMGAYNKAVQDQQQWEAAAQAVPGIQQQLQQALSDATKADSTASGQLSEGAGAANDFNVTMAQGVSAPEAEQLFSLGNELGSEGTQWYNSEVSQAVSLAQQSVKNPSQAQQLSDLYGGAARNDPLFATSVLNQLTPQQLLTLANSKALLDNSDADGSPGDAETAADSTADQQLYQFLYNTLASGTAGTKATGDLGNATHVSSAYLAGLENYGQKNLVGEPGYYGLSNILAAARPGDTPPSVTFAQTVGSRMVGWVRDNRQYSVGPNGSWANGLTVNPLDGLSNAMALSPAASQALLTGNLVHANGSTVTGKDAQSNLSFLLKNGFTSNNSLLNATGQGGNLGHMIEVAGDQGDPDTGTKITQQTVSILGGLYQHSTGYAQTMSGLDQPIATLLSHHMPGVYDSILNQGNNSEFGFNDLMRVTGVISQDSGAASTLQAAAVSQAQTNLNGAASQWQTGSGPTNFNLDAGDASQVLAYLTLAQAWVGQNAANAKAATIGSDITGAKVLSQVAGFVPQLKIPSTIVTSALGDFGSDVSTPSQAATAGGKTGVLDLTQTMNTTVANVLFSHGLAGPPNMQPPAAYQIAADGTPAPFLDASGHLLPADQISPAGQANLATWLRGQPPVHGATSSGENAGPGAAETPGAAVQHGFLFGQAQSGLFGGG